MALKMRCHLALVALAAVSALVGGLPAIRVSSEVNGKPAECGVCKVVMQKVMSDASVSASHECETTTWESLGVGHSQIALLSTSRARVCLKAGECVHC